MLLYTVDVLSHTDLEMIMNRCLTANSKGQDSEIFYICMYFMTAVSWFTVNKFRVHGEHVVINHPYIFPSFPSVS